MKTKTFDRIIEILGSETWRYSTAINKIEITKFVAPDGGIWTLGRPFTTEAKAPCGCVPKSAANQFRYYFWCPKHMEHGFIVYAYREAKWYWISPKLN